MIQFHRHPDELTSPLSFQARKIGEPGNGDALAKPKFRIFRRDGKPLPEPKGNGAAPGGGIPIPKVVLGPPSSDGRAASTAGASSARAQHAAAWGRIAAQSANAPKANGGEGTPSKIRYRTLVFVDAANLTGRRKGRESEYLIARNRRMRGERIEPIRGKAAEERIVELRDVNWAGFMQRVGLGPSGKDTLSIASALVYVHVPPHLSQDSMEQGQLKKSCSRAGFQTIFHEKTDTDPLMAADIVHFAAKHMDVMKEGEDLVLVLVTGDIDFLHAINRVKERAGLWGIRVHPWILSWRSALSAQWEKHAEVTLLDGLPIVNHEAKERMRSLHEEIGVPEQVL